MTVPLRVFLVSLVVWIAVADAPALAQPPDSAASPSPYAPTAPTNLPPLPAAPPGFARAVFPPEPSRVLAYEAQEKSLVAALAWELIPGAGSLYADDAQGAILTWALIVGGAGAMIWAISQFPPVDSGDPADNNRHPSPLVLPMLFGGMAVTTFGRVWGFVNAYGATERYNAVLLKRLGLGSNVAWSAFPFVTAAGPNAGLAVGGRF